MPTALETIPRELLPVFCVLDIPMSVEGEWIATIMVMMFDSF